MSSSEDDDGERILFIDTRESLCDTSEDDFQDALENISNTKHSSENPESDYTLALDEINVADDSQEVLVFESLNYFHNFHFECQENEAESVEDIIKGFECCPGGSTENEGVSESYPLGYVPVAERDLINFDDNIKQQDERVNEKEENNDLLNEYQKGNDINSLYDNKSNDLNGINKDKPTNFQEINDHRNNDFDEIISELKVQDLNDTNPVENLDEEIIDAPVFYNDSADDQEKNTEECTYVSYEQMNTEEYNNDCEIVVNTDCKTKCNHDKNDPFNSQNKHQKESEPQKLIDESLKICIEVKEEDEQRSNPENICNPEYMDQEEIADNHCYELNTNEIDFSPQGIQILSEYNLEGLKNNTESVGYNDTLNAHNCIENECNRQQKIAENNHGGMDDNNNQIDYYDSKKQENCEDDKNQDNNVDNKNQVFKDDSTNHEIDDKLKLEKKDITIRENDTECVNQENDIVSINQENKTNSVNQENDIKSIVQQNNIDSIYQEHTDTNRQDKTDNINQHTDIFESMNQQDDTESMNQQDNTESMNNQDNTESINQQDNTESINQQDNTESINQQDNTESINQRNNTESINQQDNTESMNQQENTENIYQHNNIEIINEQGNTDSINQQDNTEFMNQQDNTESLNQQDNEPFDYSQEEIEVDVDHDQLQIDIMNHEELNYQCDENNIYDEVYRNVQDEDNYDNISLNNSENAPESLDNFENIFLLESDNNQHNMNSINSDMNDVQENDNMIIIESDSQENEPDVMETSEIQGNDIINAEDIAISQEDVDVINVDFITNDQPIAAIINDDVNENHDDIDARDQDEVNNNQDELAVSNQEGSIQFLNQEQVGAEINLHQDDIIINQENVNVNEYVNNQETYNHAGENNMQMNHDIVQIVNVDGNVHVLNENDYVQIVDADDDVQIVVADDDAEIVNADDNAQFVDAHENVLIIDEGDNGNLVNEDDDINIVPEENHVNMVNEEEIEPENMPLMEDELDVLGILFNQELNDEDFANVVDVEEFIINAVNNYFQDDDLDEVFLNNGEDDDDADDEEDDDVYYDINENLIINVDDDNRQEDEEADDEVEGYQHDQVNEGQHIVHEVHHEEVVNHEHHNFVENIGANNLVVPDLDVMLPLQEYDDDDNNDPELVEPEQNLLNLDHGYINNVPPLVHIVNQLYVVNNQNDNERSEDVVNNNNDNVDNSLVNSGHSLENSANEGTSNSTKSNKRKKSKIPRAVSSKKDEEDASTKDTDLYDWSRMPENIIVEVMRYLSDVDRMQVAKTCKRWSLLINSSILWRSRIIRFPSTAIKAKTEAKRLKGFATRHGNKIKRLSIYCDHPSYALCKVFQKAMTEFWSTLIWQKTLLSRFAMRRLYVERYWRFDTVRERLVGSLARFLKKQTALKYVDLSDGHWGMLNGLKILEALANGCKGNRKIETINLEDFFSTRLSLFRLSRFQNILTKFKGMSHFYTNYSCLSDEILMTLATNCEHILRTLSIKVYRSEPHSHAIPPMIWRQARRLCPKLRVEIYLEGMGNYDELRHILAKDMPVSFLQIWTGIHPIDEDWKTDRLFRLIGLNFANTLEEAYLSIESEGESVDEAVLTMLQQCHKLNSLEMQTTILVETIDRLYQLVNDNKIINLMRCHINMNNLTGVDIEVLGIVNNRWLDMIEERDMDYEIDANEVILF